MRSLERLSSSCSIISIRSHGLTYKYPFSSCDAYWYVALLRRHGSMELVLLLRRLTIKGTHPLSGAEIKLARGGEITMYVFFVTESLQVPLAFKTTSETV